MSWVLFWAGLHGRLRNGHWPANRHPETNVKAWNIGLEKYFIFFQMNCSIQLELLVHFFICLNGMIWKFVFRWAEFCFGLGYMAGPGICHWYTPASWWPWLAIPRPMEKPGIYIWIYGFETYFIFCQMNCSIQLELLVDFFICLNGMIWSLFLDELSFVLGWATWPAPEYVIGTPASWWPWLAIPRPMEKPGIYMNIWLWNIFHILPNELLDPTWAFGGFLHLSQWDDLEFVFRWAEFCFGLGYMAGPGICHWYLTMTRHPETNVKAWNIGVEKYFIFCQMNCSIQLELLVDFFIFLNGMIWKFVFRWAEFCFGLGYMAGPGICHWYLTMTRHPETNGKAWNIYEYMALKHISYF